MSLKTIVGKCDEIYEIYPFRLRYEHIWRVFIWVNRLIEKIEDINKEAVLIAALFHDTGYAISLSSKEHALNSEKIFRDFLKESNFELNNTDFIAYLIKNHSNKDLLQNNNTPLELIILMEADILDETGAMSIVWDCMAEGNEKEQCFTKTLNRIEKYSCKILSNNPMVTDEAKSQWNKKQKLIENFVKEYKYDIGIE
jgi:uncharacterized protein